MNISKKKLTTLLENPLQAGRLLWLVSTVLKLTVTSLIIASRSSTGHDPLFISALVMELAVLIYLLTDPRVQNKRRFAFFISSMGIKDFFAVLYFWYPGDHHVTTFHILLLGIGYIVFNQYTVRSIAVRMVTYLYLAVSLIWILQREPVFVSAWFAMMCIATVILDIHRCSRLKREKDLTDVRREFNDLHHKYRLADAQARSVRHDMKSVLMPLQIIRAEHKTHACSTRCYDIINDVTNRVTEMMNHLGNVDRSTFNLKDAVEKILDDLPAVRPYIDLGAGLDTTITFNDDILNSLVFNFIENAREAYERLNGTAEGLKLEIDAGNGRLTIRDNAGGFDHTTVAAGKSAKKNATVENGMFLHNVITNAASYEVAIAFTPVDDQQGAGTRVELELLPTI